MNTSFFLLFLQITRKLGGKAKNTCSWCTNVGSETGEVLISVMTVGAGLAKIAKGLVARYATHGADPPQVIYVDWDCCSTRQQEVTMQCLFHPWQVPIRLDIWHYMRRLAMHVCSEAHPLYAIFMGWLSESIFEWDAGDLDLLLKAKEAELSRQHLPTSQA